jgi:hypothetical protein
MELDRMLPRFKESLARGAFLAVLDGDAPIDPPWEGEATRFILDFLESIEGERPKILGQRESAAAATDTRPSGL